jgi:DNA-binding response OmpR family regulator
MASVLIIDDDPVIQLLLRVNFEQDGFEVETASDGEEGLRKAKAMRPDLTVLDVLMPKLDGIEVLRALRSDPGTADLTVALLSAKSDPADQATGMEAGANAYLTKPFDPLALLEQVRGLIAQAQREGQL